MGKMLRNGQSKLVIIANNCPPSGRPSSSTWLSSVAPRFSTSKATMSSLVPLSPECTESACSPFRTLAIQTFSPLWSTEQAWLAWLRQRCAHCAHHGGRGRRNDAPLAHSLVFYRYYFR